MFFWIRELFGWLLVGLAICLLKVSVDYVSNRQVVEAGIVGFLALGTMRGGILLIRVSTAARIARQDASIPAPPRSPS